MPQNYFSPYVFVSLLYYLSQVVAIYLCIYIYIEREIDTYIEREGKREIHTYLDIDIDMCICIFYYLVFSMEL